MVVVDSREPWEQIAENFISDGFHNFHTEKLEHKTDFLVEGEDEVLGIQRKQVNDLVSSLTTLKDDLHELRQRRDVSMLLVEGRWKISGANIALRRGRSLVEAVPISTWHNFMFSQQRRGTLLAYTTSLSETCKVLARAEEWMQSGMSPPVSSVSDPSTLLQFFPGIGPKLASRVEGEFGGVYPAFMNVENWDEVSGIGEKTRDDCLHWIQERDQE
jgi:ERCC4-type nuclease